jgi:ubiquinone biosynthesis protein
VIAATSHLLRLARAGFVFAREGVFALVDTRPLPFPAKTAIALARLIERPTAKDGSSRLAAALTRLGPTYVKLGQFLATRPDVVGAAIARDLESLQDKMAPFPQNEAEAAIVAAFDKPLNQVYASFGPAVAAASIAQVHRAEVETDGKNTSVAVKILRPGIERRFAREPVERIIDLDRIKRLGEMAEPEPLDQFFRVKDPAPVTVYPAGGADPNLFHCVQIRAWPEMTRSRSR